MSCFFHNWEKLGEQVNLVWLFSILGGLIGLLGNGPAGNLKKLGDLARVLQKPGGLYKINILAPNFFTICLLLG